MSVGAVNKNTGDRIPTAGMPAIDSVFSSVSTNPVQNRVVKAALDEKADTDIVASDFDATASYTAGNYCIYDGKFYKFKASHSGAWSAADVDEIKIAGELSSLMSGLTNLQTVTITASEGVTISDASIKRVGKVIIGYATIELASNVSAYGVVATLSVNVASKVMYPTDSGKFFYTSENDNKVRVWRQTSAAAYIVQFVAFAND